MPEASTAEATILLQPVCRKQVAHGLHHHMVKDRQLSQCAMFSISTGIDARAEVLAVVMNMGRLSVHCDSTIRGASRIGTDSELQACKNTL